MSDADAHTCPVCQQTLTPEQAMFLPDKFGTSLADRIDASGDCWQWTGRMSGEGYGSASPRGDDRQRAAHRVIWEILVGPIPEGLEIDHLCRNRACVNPDHLEPVTHTENVRRGAGSPSSRKTHCIRGHLLSGDNVHISQGRRRCRQCDRIRQREYYHRKHPGATTYQTGGVTHNLPTLDETYQAGKDGGCG